MTGIVVRSAGTLWRSGGFGEGAALRRWCSSIAPLRTTAALGVLEDHTEGHAVRTGWRGGFARPRRWYDLDREALTDLVLCPFAAMDATYLRYLETDAQDVPNQVADLATEARQWGAPLRLLWHNESLSGEGQWTGWRDVYAQSLSAACG